MILTEEELEELEVKMKDRLFNDRVTDYAYMDFEKVVSSHRNLLSANAELSFEIIMRKKYESFLSSTIRCKGTLEDSEDFEWFKQRHHEIIKSLEDAKCKTQ